MDRERDRPIDANLPSGEICGIYRWAAGVVNERAQVLPVAGSRFKIVVRESE